MKLNAVAKHFAINYSAIGERKNILLMGDLVDDTNIIANLEYENVLKIGFLNNPKNLDKELKAFLQIYDLVIINDGSFEVPN